MTELIKTICLAAFMACGSVFALCATVWLVVEIVKSIREAKR